jgi:mono/diheme cytochrome c family protein
VGSRSGWPAAPAGERTRGLCSKVDAGTRISRAIRASWIAFIGVLACATLDDARGQNAANGATLYRSNCQVCHSPDPSTAVPPFNLIMTAANNPGQITFAANTYPSQMGFITYALTPSDLADLAAYIATVLGIPVTVDVIEYYDASQDHYFISSLQPDINALDSGHFPGWVRTGLTFKAYPQANMGASPVCRFYIPPIDGDSHFYSASPAECAAVQARFPVFVLESSNVMYIDLPDPTTGACPTADIPVYRVWDNRGDTNHRYMTSLAIRAQMVAKGWIAEGNGPDLVVMCAPQ